MGERRTRMVAVMVEHLCEKCGGLMQADGLVLTTHPPQYPHTCVECGWRYGYYDQPSGRIDYEPEAAPSPAPMEGTNDANDSQV